MKARKRRERPEDFLTPYLGRIFFRLRKKLMTQEELAAKIGIHPTTLGKIEAGEGRVRPDLAASICTALGVSPEEIVAEAIEDLKKDYRMKSAKERKESQALETDPLRVLEDKIREIHDERIRVDRELRESVFAWAREVITGAKKE